METMDRSTLEGKLLPELQQIAQTMGIEGTQRLRKAGLIDAIVEASSNGDRPDNGEANASSSRESAVATIERAPHLIRACRRDPPVRARSSPRRSPGTRTRSLPRCPAGRRSTRPRRSRR